MARGGTIRGRVRVLCLLAAGDDRPSETHKLGEFFAIWPVPFADKAAARAFLGDSPLATAWIDDLEHTPQGLYPRFDPDIMQTTIAAVHAPRWDEWHNLVTPTLAVFGENGMFTGEEKNELIRRRPATRRRDLSGASHDGHLDAFDGWIAILYDYLFDDLKESLPPTS